MSGVRKIPVIDANGDELIVYEFQDRRFIRKVRRWVLDTGEPVRPHLDDAFVLPSGELLRRIP